jgi:TolB protein
MKKIIVFLTSIFSIGTAIAAPAIAFERNDAVWIANIDGSGEKKIADGIFPAISPDGSRVAFNTVEKNGTSYIRHMAVVGVANGNITVFKDVPSDNSYYPSWSPDGKRILFTTRRAEVWDIVSVAADGTDFKTIKKGEPGKVTLYSPIWARDGKSVFCQDMTNIYQIDLDGKTITQWQIDKIIPNGGMSGDCRADVSPDGKRLLLSIEMGEEAKRKDWDGPLPAIWSFEIASQKAARLTPKKLFGWDGVWIDNNSVLFLSRGAGEKDDSVYRMSSDGKNLKRLIKNARFPGVSASAQ